MGVYYPLGVEMNSTVQLPFGAGGVLSSVAVAWVDNLGSTSNTGLTVSTNTAGQAGTNVLTAVMTTANGFVSGRTYTFWVKSALLGLVAYGPNVIDTVGLNAVTLTAAQVNQIITALPAFPTVPTAVQNAAAVRADQAVELARQDAAISTRATPAQVTAAAAPLATSAAVTTLASALGTLQGHVDTLPHDCAAYAFQTLRDGFTTDGVTFDVPMLAMGADITRDPVGSYVTHMTPATMPRV